MNAEEVHHVGVTACDNVAPVLVSPLPLSRSRVTERCLEEKEGLPVAERLGREEEKAVAGQT